MPGTASAWKSFTAKLVYQRSRVEPTAGAAGRAVRADGAHWWNLRVDATDRRLILARNDYVNDAG